MEKDAMMQSEPIIDHFYTFDNVAVFTTLTAINYFPKFREKILNSGYLLDREPPLSSEGESNHRIIFAAVNSDNLITSQIFDELHLFGCAIFNLNTRTIDYFKVENHSKVVRTRILDIITNKIQGDIFLNLPPSNNPNFDIDAVFYVKYGFTYPQIINNIITLKYVDKPSTKTTLMQIKAAVTSQKTNVFLLNMFIPRVVATTLSKCIKELNEAAGNLTIVKYINDGVALIGLNSDDIQSGDEGQVGLPEKYSPFVFHTHPDHITREFKAFISWPSGQDMMVVVLSFLQFRDQLVHFVASPEGLWTIHITVEFQKLLIKLRSTNAYTCSQSMLQAIYNIFTQFETQRLTTIDPIERYNIGGQYLSATKNYKLSNLFADVPQLNSDCKTDVSEDAQLFNISLIKWKKFSENVEEGVYLTFDYILDVPGGLVPFFFPISFF
ncbi:hypothetical protein DH26_gp093 [Chloriridovirus anopheles1]|uniref:Uncharacterized protein n=1 Tax=Chloriridovirus anopheles1 TaxID=1465751 RepID=W8R9Q4_9VIRU|nr:hypothetical protein DH26_gp093 [Anopheles minimus iridovirus]AHL67586.1 hypothetical protein AMIV_093 [Anopheles minimus iridovirus]